MLYGFRRRKNVACKIRRSTNLRVHHNRFQIDISAMTNIPYTEWTHSIFARNCRKKSAESLEWIGIENIVSGKYPKGELRPGDHTRVPRESYLCSIGGHCLHCKSNAFKKRKNNAVCTRYYRDPDTNYSAVFCFYSSTSRGQSEFDVCGAPDATPDAGTTSTVFLRHLKKILSWQRLFGSFSGNSGIGVVIRLLFLRWLRQHRSIPKANG